MHNAIAVALSVVTPVYSQEALLVMRSLSVFAADLIRVRGSQFPLQFPEEVGEFRTRRDPFNQRRVELVHLLPVDARHVFCPELLALQTPRLRKHLFPFGGRLHRDFHAVQIDPTAFTAGAIAVIRLGRLVASLQYAQARVRTINERLAIARKLKEIDALDQKLVLLRLKVVTINAAFGVLRQERLVDCSLDRKSQEQRFALGPADTGVTAFGYRERHNAPGNPIQVNGNWSRFVCVFCLALLTLLPFFSTLFSLLGPFAFFLLLHTFLLFLPLLIGSFGFRNKRRAQVAAQHNSIWLHTTREAEIELQVVIDRVEDAIPQEVQVFPFRIKCRRDIVKYRIGHNMRFAALHIAELIAVLRPVDVNPYANQRPSGDQATPCMRS